MSAQDYLWGIDLSGHLCKRSTQFIDRLGTTSKARRKSHAISPEPDWELLEL